MVQSKIQFYIIPCNTQKGDLFVQRDRYIKNVNFPEAAMAISFFLLIFEYEYSVKIVPKSFFIYVIF